MWLTSQEATKARTFAKDVCGKVPGLTSAWNNHAKAIYFYYGTDCQQAAFTYEIASKEGMYAALGPQDVDDLLYVLRHGQMSNSEKDAIRERNERLDAQKSEQALGEMIEEMTPEMNKTLLARDQERRGVKKIIVGG